MSTSSIISSAAKNVQGGATATGNCISGKVAQQNTLPSWLTRDYLEIALRAYHMDNALKITSMYSRPPLEKRENFDTVLTRFKAEYRTGAGRVQQGYYIAKTLLEADKFSSRFNREMKICQEVLPKIRAILKESGDSEELFAETVFVDYEHSALIFEDLKFRYFEVPDPIKGLDTATAKIALRKLAKMHATSAVLNEREKGSLEPYNSGVFNRTTENFQPCFVDLLEACTRMVRQWENAKESGKKLADLRPVYMELARRLFDPIKDHLNVLAHGNFWTSNILVKYDRKSGSASDAIIIDFQHSAWGSPDLDLFHFMNASLQEELRLRQQDELIKYYYYILADTLRKLLYRAPIPSLHKFHLQLEDNCFYAFQTSCIVFPGQRLDETDHEDFPALIQENERSVNSKHTCYGNPYIYRIQRQQLPLYERCSSLETQQ